MPFDEPVIGRSCSLCCLDFQQGFSLTSATTDLRTSHRAILNQGLQLAMFSAYLDALFFPWVLSSVGPEVKPHMMFTLSRAMHCFSFFTKYLCIGITDICDGHQISGDYPRHNYVGLLAFLVRHILASTHRLRQAADHKPMPCVLMSQDPSWYMGEFFPSWAVTGLELNVIVSEGRHALGWMWRACQKLASVDEYRRSILVFGYGPLGEWIWLFRSDRLI